MRSFIFVLSFLISLFSVRVQAEDWPQFLGPNQNGKSSEKGIIKDWSNGLPLIWTKDLDTSYGIGVVSQGKYFQFDRTGNKERLTCLNATTGDEIWKVDQSVEYRDMYGYNNGPRSSPTVYKNWVITYGVAGRLTCVKKSDGSIVWSRDLNKEFGVIQNFFGVACTPVIHDDKVIVMVGGSPSEDQRLPLGRLDMVSGNGSGIVAFDVQSGKESYRLSNQLASYSTPLLTNISGRITAIAFMRGGLIAFDPDKGTQLWEFPWRSDRLESVNAALPVVRDNQILISECYDIGSAMVEVSAEKTKLLRKDPRNRREQSFRAHWATPIEHNGYLFGCSGRNKPDSDLRCIRWSDGKLMWQHNNLTRTSLLYVDDHFVVLDEDGVLELIRATSEKYQRVGELNLTKSYDGHPAPFLEPPCWAAPILANGLLYVRGANRVACFRLGPQSAS